MKIYRQETEEGLNYHVEHVLNMRDREPYKIIKSFDNLGDVAMHVTRERFKNNKSYEVELPDKDRREFMTSMWLSKAGFDFTRHLIDERRNG